MVTKAQIEAIMSAKADASRFQIQPRGFIDWRFSDLCAFKGYPEAVIYAEAMRKWVNYAAVYAGKCQLDITYAAFLEAKTQHGI